MRNLRNNIGITLISLVVTIVVLLILTGVTIVTLTGENGILTRTSESKENTIKSEEKEGVELAVTTTHIGNNGYEELNQNNLQKAIDNQFGIGKAIVVENGDGTFTVSFVDSKRDYNITSNGIENSIDWNKSMLNAVAPKSQDEERNNGVIGIGTDGNPVDMDLWKYTLMDDGTYVLNDIKDTSGGSSTWTNGYISEEFNMDGTIIGTVPQYISTDGGKHFKPVTSMLMTFKDCSELKVQPKIPSTVTKLEYTFWNCSNLVTVNKVHNGVITMLGIYMNCTSIAEIPEIPDSVTILTSAFAGTNISVAPKIPNRVEKMRNTFGRCINLKETPYIPDSVIDFHQTFASCINLEKVTNLPQYMEIFSNTFYGCTNLKSVPNTIPNTVLNMTSTFQGSGLIEAPDIPSSVKNMSHTFRECHNLEGTLIINANPDTYLNCFYNCSTNITGNLVLKGSSNILSDLLNTKTSKSKIIM